MSCNGCLQWDIASCLVHIPLYSCSDRLHPILLLRCPKWLLDSLTGHLGGHRPFFPRGSGWNPFFLFRSFNCVGPFTCLLSGLWTKQLCVSCLHYWYIYISPVLAVFDGVVEPLKSLAWVEWVYLWKHAYLDFAEVQKIYKESCLWLVCLALFSSYIT